MGIDNITGLHPRNLHKSYDFLKLCKVYPPLESYVFINKYQTSTIDFSNPAAVKKLNRALLFSYYNIKFWDFPDANLCPPIPGRVDYIHHLADLLEESGLRENSFVLDIGTGASCIYPLLGNATYGWHFVGTDSDQKSLKSAQKIIEKNSLAESIELKFQPDSSQILKGILNGNSKFSASICNPPFFKSEEDAFLSHKRKLSGLGQAHTSKRNFSGTQYELWYKGGEKAFLHNYLYESSLFKKQCFWYTSLVSKKENLKSMSASLKKLNATEIRNIPMNQGNKISRIVAWTFLSKKEQEEWNQKL